MWYTLTGNFGNLLPIDYWSKTLMRKYHTRSLNLKLDNSRNKKRDVKKSRTGQMANTSSYNESRRNSCSNKHRLETSFVLKSMKQTCKDGQQNEEDDDDDDDTYFYDEEENFRSIAHATKSNDHISDSISEDDDDDEGDDDNEDDEFSSKENSEDEENIHQEKDQDDRADDVKGKEREMDEDEVDPLEFDEIDDDELKEQLDMHSMIVSRNIYGTGDEFDEPIITAEQVLNEIDSIISLEVIKHFSLL